MASDKRTSRIFSDEFQQRFWAKVRRTDGGCWEWTAYRNASGYGMLCIAYGLRPELAHRISYLLSHGVDASNFVCHHCDNPPCVNPAHLYDGTRKQNARDSVNRGRNPNANKTHCSKGHPYTADNTTIYTARGYRERVCKRCIAISHAARRRRGLGSTV